MPQIAIRVKPGRHIDKLGPGESMVSGPWHQEPNGGFTFVEEEIGRRLVLQGCAEFADAEAAARYLREKGRVAATALEMLPPVPDHARPSAKALAALPAPPAAPVPTEPAPKK